MLVVLVEVLAIAMLILVNGALAGSEIALVSAGKGRLQARAKAGDRRAAMALELTASPNRFLSVIQIGITLVGITAGAVGATALAGSLSAVLVEMGMPPGQATVLGIIVVISAITFLTLVVGELVPKRLALGDPEGVAMRIARPMTALARFATPVVHLLSASTDLVLRLLPWKLTLQPTVTEEDIERLVAEATASGILEKTEQDVVRRLFHLSDQTVETLMTPRERIVWLDRGASQSERRLAMTGAGHSRFIVCDGELDRIRGYVKVQDLLDLCLQGEEPDTQSVLRRPHMVSPWTPAFRILEQFQRSGDHIAIVQSGAGRVIGLVTLNDVLKNIVGDLPRAARDGASGGRSSPRRVVARRRHAPLRGRARAHRSRPLGRGGVPDAALVRRASPRGRSLGRGSLRVEGARLRSRGHGRKPGRQGAGGTTRPRDRYSLTACGCHPHAALQRDRGVEILREP